VNLHEPPNEINENGNEKDADKQQFISFLLTDKKLCHEDPGKPVNY
jgi:hypothetical protein